jgi:hypothetical protein
MYLSSSGPQAITTSDAVNNSASTSHQRMATHVALRRLWNSSMMHWATRICTAPRRLFTRGDAIARATDRSGNSEADRFVGVRIKAIATG